MSDWALRHLQQNGELFGVDDLGATRSSKACRHLAVSLYAGTLCMAAVRSSIGFIGDRPDVKLANQRVWNQVAKIGESGARWEYVAKSENYKRS